MNETKQRRRWTIGAPMLVVAALAFTAGTFVAPEEGGEAEADYRDDANAACQTLWRWKADGQVPPRELAHTWRGYAVAGHARAAAEDEKKYGAMGAAAEPLMTAITKLDAERIETSVDAMTKECRDLGLRS